MIAGLRRRGIPEMIALNAVLAVNAPLAQAAVRDPPVGD
jgi:hypothetical protein